MRASEHRLPARAIPLFAVHAIRELLPLLLLGLLSGRLDLQELGFWLFAGTAGVTLGLLNWYTTRFAFLPEHVSLKSGLLFREHRQLPWERIQNLSVTRGLLHRLLGISQLRIEAASGVGSEIHLNGMTEAQIADLRQRFDALQAAPARDGVDLGQPATPFKQLPTSELVRLGLIENRGLIVIGAAFGVLLQIEELRHGIYRVLEKSEPLLAALAIDRSEPGGQLLGWGLLLLVWLVLVRMFSIAHAIWVHHGFRLRISADRLGVEEGLVTRKQLSGRIPRIQRVRVREGWLHRAFGRVSIRIASAAQLALNETGTQLRDVLPIGTPGDARRLLPILLPDWDWTARPREGLPPRVLAMVYLTRLPGWLAALLIGGAFHDGLAVLLTAAAAIDLLRLCFWVRNTRLQVGRDGLLLIRVGLSRQADFLPRARIQGRSLSQGPIERRFGLATVRLDVAGGGAMSWLTLPPLAQDRALALLRELEPEATSC